MGTTNIEKKIQATQKQLFSKVSSCAFVCLAVHLYVKQSTLMNHEVLKDDQANQTLVPFGIAYLASFIVALPSYIFVLHLALLLLKLFFLLLHLSLLLFH
uniref:Uncharacterized protein n=1 Tax=Opuntia streptacantha TaxID=393608 RepID=A0A7C9E7U1_OPUST